MYGEIAVYKGDELLCIGSFRHCARVLKVRPDTLYFYLMPSYERRIAKRGPRSNPANVRRVVRV